MNERGAAAHTMRLRIILPSRVLVETSADKVVAEGEDGSFALLPRHIDFVTGLAASVLSYVSDEEEHFVAVNGGILVKRGYEVDVSVAEAVEGESLDTMRAAVADFYEYLTEEEYRARAALHRIEADFVRRFVELEQS